MDHTERTQARGRQRQPRRWRLGDLGRRRATFGRVWRDLGCCRRNSNTNADSFSPARVREAITVGATDRTDTRASYSNYGAALDLFARVRHYFVLGDQRHGHLHRNGTSFASPHAAGAAALFLSTNTTATPAQVRRHWSAKRLPEL
ncbi:S8 family serine peptidase [Kibdelosporangium philippinense]|uniref:S8 family serine peptidase n=1 Tax=Kibdelosporangium philippinense TaxID=211113 RepID=UPI00361024D9